MGAAVTREDFERVGTDIPHATRRDLILKKHPEIKKLMRCDPRFKWIITSVVMVQFVSFYLLKDVTSFWKLFFIAYFFGGLINHSLTLAIHEICHNQAFGNSRPLANKLFGIFTNLPLGIPISVSFKRYHLDHHIYLGIDTLDPDSPTEFEAKFFTTTFRKLIWVFLQPLFYSLRPLFVNPKKPVVLEYVNLIAQLSFDYFIGVTCGWHIVAYMIGGSLVCMGLHPCAGHFISEHYLMVEENKESVMSNNKNEIIEGIYMNDGKMLIPETSSYYGPLNWITFNVGYHVEHHDFPSIPFTLLPKVKEYAPEYYNSLSYHTSWIKVIWTYITDPRMGPVARVKRQYKDSGLDWMFKDYKNEMTKKVNGKIN